jgi:hypothetical protein
MKDTLISFETAKLAKEKGFYHMEANVFGDNKAYSLGDEALINAHEGNVVEGYILAPTQSLLQKWLRDEHGLIVESQICSTFRKGTYSWVIFKLRSKLGEHHPRVEDLDKEQASYEEALEIGLFQALKLI